MILVPMAHSSLKFFFLYIYSTKNLQDKLPITLHTNYLTNTTRTLLPQGAIDHDNPVEN